MTVEKSWIKPRVELNGEGGCSGVLCLNTILQAPWHPKMSLTHVLHICGKEGQEEGQRPLPVSLYCHTDSYLFIVFFEYGYFQTYPRINIPINLNFIAKIFSTNFFFFFFWLLVLWPWEPTQHLTHARRAFYLWAASLAPSCWITLFSPCLLQWVSANGVRLLSSHGCSSMLSPCEAWFFPSPEYVFVFGWFVGIKFCSLYLLVVFSSFYSMLPPCNLCLFTAWQSDTQSAALWVISARDWLLASCVTVHLCPLTPRAPCDWMLRSPDSITL